ncbi:hypothetical protein MASR2M117_17920 [Paludibacter sp.]
MVIPYAQVTNDKLYPLTRVNNDIDFSVVELVDPYLSSLNYTGVGVRFESDYNRYFDPSLPVLSSYSRVSGLFAMTMNPKLTATIVYVGGDCAVGMLYEYREFKNFILKGGGNISLDVGYKINSRNVNNPMNVDLSTNLNGMLDLKYVLQARKRTMHLGTKIEFPIIGCMFAPYPGLSYYELTSSKSYAEAIHFSSFHNKQGIKQDISINVPFNRSTWKFGVRLNQLKYLAGSHQYRFNEFSLIIGSVFDNINFSGKKVVIPDNFISPGR